MRTPARGPASASQEIEDGRRSAGGFHVAIEIARSAILQEPFGYQPGILAKRRLDLARQLRIVAQEQFCVLAALPEPLRIVGEPGARLLDHAGLDAEIDQLAGLRHALAIHDVELDLLEGRRELVLHDLDAGLVADHLVAVLDRADAADVEADRSV